MIKFSHPQVQKIWDDTHCLRRPIWTTCKSAFYHWHRTSPIFKFLTPAATKTIVHSFILSCLSYCNSAHSRLPDSDICKLQCVQIAAACLVTYRHKCNHITPVPRKLCWLPVRPRILFKILVLTYKALNSTALLPQSPKIQHLPPWCQCLFSICPMSIQPASTCYCTGTLPRDLQIYP